MAKIISIALQKGGTGKTTTALCLSDILGYKGHKVLLIDLDTQQNATYCCGVDVADKTITDVLSGDCPAGNALIKCVHHDLIAADDFLTNVERADDIKPTLLRDCLGDIRHDYDYIIIDTPPALGNLSFNALAASNYVIIPTEARPFSIQGLTKFNDTFETVKRRINPDIKMLGILLVKYSTRTILNRDLLEMINNYANRIGTTVFNSFIREGVSVPESQTIREPLINYAPNSNPAKDYFSFANEVLEKIGG